MAFVTTPTTELEAVNILLATIGETPVSSSDFSGLADALAANAVLSRVNREVQAQGWHFNTDRKFTLTTDINNEFLIPANTLQIDTVAEDIDKNLVARAGKLYDVENHTTIFTDFSSVECDIVLLLPFESIPQVARDYIVIRAARIFQDNNVGSDKIHQFTLRDERDAYFRLRRVEGRTSDRNMLSGTRSMLNIVNRQIGTW